MEQFWSDIERRFLNLHNDHASTNGFPLHAVNDCDGWELCGGTKNIKKQFEWLAECAAQRLGVPPGSNPVFFWFDRLKKESPRYERFNVTTNRRKSELDSQEMCSLEREISRSEGGVIGLLCIASAEYCVRCDSQEQTKRDADPRIAKVGEQSPKAILMPSNRRTSKFGENIRRLRAELGWSAGDLSGKSGIDKKQVIAHENGTQPHPKNKALYADTFTKGFTKKNGAPTKITVQDLEK